MRFLLAIALCLAPALATPQSLGDAARRQARRRGTEASAPKVYTSEDLRPTDDGGEAVSSVASGPEAVPAVAGETAEVGPPPPTAAADDALRARLDREAAERKRRERYWRQLTGAARARLAAAQHEHDRVCGPLVLVLTGG